MIETYKVLLIDYLQKHGKSHIDDLVAHVSQLGKTPKTIKQIVREAVTNRYKGSDIFGYENPYVWLKTTSHDADWVSEIIECIKELGGSFDKYSDLYKLIKQRNNLPLNRYASEKNWQGRVRQIIQENSSDTKIFNGKNDIFYSIHGIGHGSWGLKRQSKQLEQLKIEEEKDLNASMQLSNEERANRLLKANKKPEKVNVVSTQYRRNQDVVAQVLINAKGVCQGCKKSAPFIKKSDGKPYLEVHHIKPLSKGGEDTVENSAALCPNCHRKAHFG